MKQITGRQLYWLILKELAKKRSDDTVNDLEDLLEVNLRGDNIRGFQIAWNKCLQGMTERPQDSVLSTLYHRQIKASEQFRTTYDLYEMDLAQKNSDKTYERIYDMVTSFLEQKKRDHASSRPSRYAAPLTQVDEPKWRKGDCSSYYNYGRCDATNCPYSHTNTKAPKGKGEGKKGKGKGKKGKGKGKDKDKGKGKGKQDRGRSQERSPSRDREPQSRGRSPSGKSDAKLCMAYKKGTCQLGKNCDKWHPPKCRYHDNGTCNLGRKCPFLHRDPSNSSAAPAAKAKAKAATAKAKAKAKGNRAKSPKSGTAALALVTVTESEQQPDQ